MGALVLKVSRSPPWPGANFRSDDSAHGGPAASFTQPTSNRQPPQPQWCAPTAATAHVTLRKKAEEDTQARTMERTHSYRKRHQRTGVHIPHASSLLQCTDPCNTSSFLSPSLSRRGKNRKKTSQIAWRGDPKKLKLNRELKRFLQKMCLCRTYSHHCWCVCERQTLFQTYLSQICKCS